MSALLLTSIGRFNRTLFRLRGQAIGVEHKGKGVHVALGPMMNMGYVSFSCGRACLTVTSISRIAQGGRNWEGFGADPFLTGEAAYETILGMQGAGVQACAKHYINKCVTSFVIQLSWANSGAVNRSTNVHRSHHMLTIEPNTRSTHILLCEASRRVSPVLCAATVSMLCLL